MESGHHDWVKYFEPKSTNVQFIPLFCGFKSLSLRWSPAGVDRSRWRQSESTISWVGVFTRLWKWEGSYKLGKWVFSLELPSPTPPSFNWMLPHINNFAHLFKVCSVREKMLMFTFALKSLNGPATSVVKLGTTTGLNLVPVTCRTSKRCSRFY